MKTKIKSSFLSILLVLVMVLSVVPFGALPAFAAEPSVVVTHDVDEIRELLRQDGDVSIKLDADANKTIVSTHENRDDEKEYEEGMIFDSKKVWTRIGSGNKTIDLNGHRLYVTETLDQRAGVWKAVMMEIPTGASLTVNDSAGGGMIWFDAEMYDPDDIYYEGNSGLKIRDTFYVTGGDLTVNGGEIHAGRARRVWAYYVAKVDKNWQWIGSPWYEEWYEGRDETPEDNGYHNWYYTGYATQFNSGTAITAYDGNVTINGGSFWGRGWDNYTIISRVPSNPNGPDDHRDRCAALRVKGGQVTINAGEFYGRSDADAIQVLDPADLTVNSGTFDVSTNDYLTEPFLYYELVTVFHSSRFDVHMGNLGSFGVPNECINDQSVKVTKGNTMTLSKNVIDPYIVIDDLAMYVNAPLDYRDISTEVYSVPEGCTVKSVTWYKNGAKIVNPKSTYFQKGQRYSVYIALSVDIQTGTKFTNRLSDATINGKEAEINRVDEENLIMSVDFGYCTAALEDLEFEVIEPAEGQYANSWVDTSEYELYAPVGGYSNYGDFRTWYVSDDGKNWTEKSTDDVFEAGKYYRFSFEVHAGEGQEFALDGSLDPDVSVTVNGIHDATVKRVYDMDPSEHILVEVDFGKCPNTVPQVDLTVTAPKEGNKPSYTVGCGSNAYYAVGGNSNYTEYRTWYMSSDNDDWWEINSSHKFMAGYYYKLVVDIRTNEGYEFPLYDNGTSIMPDVNAYVNNYAAKVIKAYEQDPSNYVTVEYNFGECNDSVVESIIIENVTAPVAGEKPDYNWSVRGNGYKMNTAKNAYEDVYWKNPPEKWYYIKNGIGWFDLTESDWVYENETFIAGHEYTVNVYLITEGGYEFSHNKWYEPTVAATVNGYKAEAATTGSACISTQQIRYTFTCEAQEISTVMLYDLEKPVGGNKPDTSVTPAYPEYYTVESVKWFDIEDNPAGAVFESGVPYYALITVAPADSGVVFADSDRMQVYIDGNILPGVDVKNNKVIIPVIIRKPASAPIVNPYVFLTQPQGGTLKVGETLTAYWQTSFIPTQTEIQYWDGKAWDQWDVQQAQTAADNYDFVGVDAGSYRFRIAAYVGNQVVVTSNEFVITWEEETATEFIYVYGVGEGQGSGDFDYVTSGTVITLQTPEYIGIYPIDGFKFDYWSIRIGNAQASESARKRAGETIIINDNTYIIAMWKEIPHVCSGVKQKGQAATCTIPGWKDYYKCSCGKFYADAACTKNIADLWVWKNGEGKLTADHVYGTWQTNNDRHWKECSCGAKSAEGAHVYTSSTDVVCDTCGYNRTLPHTCGNAVKQNGQSATCTVDGWNDYYKCSCGKLYTEAACTNEITDLEAWKTGAGKIEASHNYGTLVSAVTEKHTQTELVAGAAAHYHCSACGKYFTEGKVETTIEVLTGTTPSHSYGDWKTDADKHWKECSCGKKADEGNHFDANSNNKCDFCDKTLSSGGVTPPPHTHDYGTTWKSDGTNHWKECSCGDKKEVTAHSGGTATCEAKAKCSECNTEYGELAEHKYSEATCTAKAKCSVCGDEKGELAAHTYVDGKCACGATDPNYQPPHEHNFVEGKCECGETDPNYSPGTDTPGTDVPGTDVPETDKPEDPDNGLSDGAVAGIVAGSVAVLGGGGFALWWFVFRKKKLI